MQYKLARRQNVGLQWVLVILVILTLVACGNTTPAEQIIGKWKLSRVISQGETRSGDDLEDKGVLEFFEDGTITYSSDRDDTDPQSDKGTYTLRNNGQLMTTFDTTSRVFDVEIKIDTLIIANGRFVEPGTSLNASDSSNGQRSNNIVMVYKRVN